MGPPTPPWPSLLLVGPTGAGKTPLGEEIEKRGLQGRPCVHFDFGSNLRRAAQGGNAELGLTGPEIERIRDSLRSGALFESRDLPMITKILRRFVETRRLGPGGLLVLNGLPRHRDQAEALASFLAVERVVSLEADASIIVDRIGRDTGQDRAGRPDDDLPAVARRLETFRRSTAPLLDFYRDRGVPVTAVPVTALMTAADMYAELDRRLRTGGL